MLCALWPSCTWFWAISALQYHISEFRGYAGSGTEVCTPCEHQPSCIVVILVSRGRASHINFILAEIVIWEGSTSMFCFTRPQSQRRKQKMLFSSGKSSKKCCQTSSMHSNVGKLPCLAWQCAACTVVGESILCSCEHKMIAPNLWLKTWRPDNSAEHVVSLSRIRAERQRGQTLCPVHSVLSTSFLLLFRLMHQLAQQSMILQQSSLAYTQHCPQTFVPYCTYCT